MILYAIFGISVMAMLVDWYIYRRVISRHFPGKFWRWGYILYALIVDLAIVTALAVYRRSLDDGTADLLHAVTWVIFIFFANALPKTIYAAFSLLDYFVGSFRKKPSHVFGYIGTVAGLAVLGAMVWGATAGRSRIEVRRVEISSPRIPAAFDGYRIAQFSDAHIGMLVNPDKVLTRLVDTLNALRPDMVVQSGDLVNAHAGELTPEFIRILSGIHAKDGVYAVLGNHDLGFYIHDTVKIVPEESVRQLLEIQRHMDWHPLVNESVWLRRGADSVILSGLNFPSSYKHNGHDSKMSGVDLEKTYAGFPDSAYNIAISHAPQLWDNLLLAGRGDLTMAGHVHSMQMKFRIGNWVWSPARWMYTRWSGLYTEGDRHLYINDGLGYVMYPMRIGTYPEVTLYTLRRSPESNPVRP